MALQLRKYASCNVRFSSLSTFLFQNMDSILDDNGQNDPEEQNEEKHPFITEWTVPSQNTITQHTNNNLNSEFIVDW